MEYENQDLELKFVIPDRLTVRQQMEYDGLIAESGLSGAGLYERLWNGARKVILDWQCAYLALDANLDEIDDRRAALAIEWAGRAAFGHVMKTERVEKNS